MHTRGKSETSTEVQPQALTMQPCSKSRQRLSSQMGENQFSHDFYFMPLDSPLSLIRPSSIKEAYGSRHLLLDLSSPNFSPTSHQGCSCQHTSREDTACTHFRSSFPTKATGLTQTAQGHFHTSTYLQDQERSLFHIIPQRQKKLN